MGAQKRIVVVEDEADLADLLAYNLQRAGYDVLIARDGPSGLAIIQESAPDLVILDVMLPQLSGLEIARQVRTSPRLAATPILMLTARAAEQDQLAGLSVGADDYVTKPFSVKVLLARVAALLRRSGGGAAGPDGDSIALGPIVADLANHELVVDGAAVKTTLTEFRLLAALLRAGGKTLSRYDLMSKVMGPGVLVTTRTIDVHIASLRKKLGPHGGMIRTVRGVGYRLTESAEADNGGEEAAT